MEDILDFRRETFVYNKFLVGGISNNFVEWVSFNLVPWFPFFFLIKNIFPHHPTTSKRKHYQRRKLQQKHLGQAELQMEQGKRQKHALRNHWINSGQIIATSHDLGPQNVAEEGKSLYFMEIQVGEIL